ncbi:MAG: ASKHA domain-containing protein [Syntrophorhabdaceae bacterium]|nr:ASKHA domain-containing protein [Syntrophorhabdaceae bacterium]
MEKGKAKTVKEYKVLFLPSSKEITVKEGRTILDIAREAGVYINSQCNGKGSCGKCRVQIMEGKANPFTHEESDFIRNLEKEFGYRLACKARIQSDVKVLVPGENVLTSEASKKIFTKGATLINPAVKGYQISLDMNKTDYTQGISEKLCTQHGLPDVTIDSEVIQSLRKEPLRDKSKIVVFVWMDKEVVALHPNESGISLGLALDIGTTTVALYLCDLVTGDIIASGSITNPQVLFGTDVMSRIEYSTAHPVEGTRRMRGELIKAVNALIDEMVTRNGCSPNQIIDMTVVGNTVMHHIFLGIVPDRLGLWPFEPSIKESVNIKARELGMLINPSSYVHVLPVEAGFVGADNVGVLISEEPYNGNDLSLTIDIGTNGEVVLGNRETLLSCSCATGPALEGAHISCGMRAAPGAIEKVRIHPDTLEVDYVVIGNKGWASEQGRCEILPSGVCGSGIIDTVAHLFKTGVIKANGSFQKTLKTPRLRRGRSGSMEFVLVRHHESATGSDIVFTQKDIRQVQLAKAALHGGCRVLMNHLKIDAIHRIIISGAFGMHIDKESALAIGLFPWCEPENITMVGNAAGHGAYLALINREKREEADRIAGMVTHIELALEEKFQKEFLRALSIPYKPD